MRKWVVLFVVLVILFGILGYVSFGSYSEGRRGGSIYKFSKKGYIFKTYEGELKMGGLMEGDGTLNTTEWEFSVSSSNKDAIDKIQKAIDNGSRVSLIYEEKFFIFPWNGDTKNFVTKVELIGPVNDGRQYNQFPERKHEVPVDSSSTTL